MLNISKIIYEYYNKYSRIQLMSVIAIILFIFLNIFAHSFFAIVFQITEIYEMRTMNIICDLILIYSLFRIFNKKQYLPSLYGAILTFLIYILVSTYLLGFQKYPIMLYPILVYGIFILVPFGYFHRTILIGISTVVALLTLYIKNNTIPTYGNYANYILFVNVFFSIGSISFILASEKLSTFFYKKFSDEKFDLLSRDIIKDSVTGIWNENTIYHEFDKLRDFDNVYIVVANINDYSSIKEKYSEKITNSIYNQFAIFLKQEFKVIDIVATWTDDNFIILVDNSLYENIEIKMQDMLYKIKGKNFRFQEQDFRITASFGIKEVAIIFQFCRTYI